MKHHIVLADVDDILDDRAEHYGDFATHAEAAQALKDMLRSMPQWEVMESVQKEALEMIAMKLARVCHGDSEYVDSWTDIAGYARLVERYLTELPE